MPINDLRIVKPKFETSERDVRLRSIFRIINRGEYSALNEFCSFTFMRFSLSSLSLSLSLSVSLLYFSFLHRFYAPELNKRNHLVSSSNAADLRETTSRPDRELTEKSKRFSLLVVSHDFHSAYEDQQCVSDIYRKFG